MSFVAQGAGFSGPQGFFLPKECIAPLPLYSPDFNPYNLWMRGVIREKSNSHSHVSVPDLKKAIKRASGQSAQEARPRATPSGSYGEDAGG